MMVIVKTFVVSANDSSDLQNKINDKLNNISEERFIDIKFSSTKDSTGLDFFTAIIIYKGI